MRWRTDRGLRRGKDEEWKCLERWCERSFPQDKWQDHCRRKHKYKYTHRISVRHRIVTVKKDHWKHWASELSELESVILDRRSMAPGTSSMLRARRRDVNVKPNRVLDRNSSRGMIYENEELRLRTININAEVEKAGSDIKKLRRENDQLRREIWNLRDEYDRLESLYKAKVMSTDEEEAEDEEEEEEREEGEEEEEDISEETEPMLVPQESGTEDSTNATSGVKKEGDVLSVIDEQNEEVSDTSEDTRPRTVSFREESLRVGVPGNHAMDTVTPLCWPDSSYIPGPQIYVPGLQNIFQEHHPEVLAPGGSEVVTTAILQRRQSYTQHGDQTKDTFTCSASQHTAPAQFNPTRDCESYTGPSPSFLRLNSVQPFTLVFPVTEPRLSNLSVQEVIDSLSDQLAPLLMHSLRGVRLVGGSCYLSFTTQHDADSALSTPLKIRGLLIKLEDASLGSTIVSLSGVPHDLPDDAVASVLSHFGSLVGPVERRLYKGVDTGERLVRIRAKLAIPRWIWLDGCRVCLKVLKNEEVSNHHMTRRKSFRSHINVQLKPVVDDSTSIPAPSSSSSTPYSTPPPRSTLSNTNPFLCGSVPTIPIVPSVDVHPPLLSNTSVSTPNIFQESPFLFPSPFQPGESPGLRRINSFMGTMSLGGVSPEIQTRSASSPPTVKHADDPGQTSIPPSPNTQKKTTRKTARKISKMSTDSRKTNGETSSSDQDSPNKPGRRRPSSVIFKQKPILNRNLSVDQDGTCLSGYEATCSERERSNSDLSSRQSICKRKLSTTGRESGKVPWCGCWGNGCI